MRQTICPLSSECKSGTCWGQSDTRSTSCRPLYAGILQDVRETTTGFFGSAQQSSTLLLLRSHSRCECVCVRACVCMYACTNAGLCDTGASVSPRTSPTVLLSAGSSFQRWQQATGAKHIWRWRSRRRRWVRLSLVLKGRHKKKQKTSRIIFFHSPLLSSFFLHKAKNVIIIWPGRKFTHRPLVINESLCLAGAGGGWGVWTVITLFMSQLPTSFSTKHILHIINALSHRNLCLQTLDRQRKFAWKEPFTEVFVS